MISNHLDSLMVLLVLGFYIQYFLLRVLRFSPAHLIPASPAVPSQPGTALLPWSSQRPFCTVPATAWRKLGKGWETLHPGAYCTLKYELADLGRLPPRWLSLGSKGMLKFLSQFMCITWKFPGQLKWKFHPSCKNENMKSCDTVWLSNVHLSFQCRHWKIDHQRSGSWEWHRWGAWGWGLGVPVGSRRRCWNIGQWGELLRHQWQRFSLKRRRAEGRVELG